MTDNKFYGQLRESHNLRVCCGTSKKEKNKYTEQPSNIKKPEKP